MASLGTTHRFGVTPPGAVLGALSGVLLGMSAYTFYFAEGLSYLSNDPRACINCHIMSEHYDGWEKSPHHAVATCNDCHVPQDLAGKYLTKVEHGYRHSKGFTLQDFHEPIQIKASSLAIVHQNCVRCHAAFVAEVVGHQQGSAIDLNCVACHSAVAHGPTR